MTFERQEENGCAVLSIQGPLTINEAAAIRDEMIKCFDGYDDIIIDLNDVSEFDAAGIQLICSARLTAQEKRKGFKVAGASMNSIGALERAGFNPDEVLCSVVAQ